MLNFMLTTVGSIKELRDVDFNSCFVVWGSHLTSVGFIHLFIHLYLFIYYRHSTS